MTEPDQTQSMSILLLFRKGKGIASFLSMNIVKVLKNFYFNVKNVSDAYKIYQRLISIRVGYICSTSGIERSEKPICIKLTHCLRADISIL